MLILKSGFFGFMGYVVLKMFVKGVLAFVAKRRNLFNVTG